MKEQTHIEVQRDAATRRELVTPAANDYRPKRQGRAVELALIPKKTMLRKGESFWYRAEIANVGTEALVIADPFIDAGSGGDGWSKFRLEISPSTPDSGIGGSAGEPCVFDHPPVRGWESMTEAEKKSATERWALEESVPRGRINVTLSPGERIRTRDWRVISREESCAGWKAGNPAPERPGGLFRQHDRAGDFQKPGTYHVKLVLDDPGTAGSKKLREILAANGNSPKETDIFLNGPFSRPALSATSNVVAVEVLP